MKMTVLMEKLRLWDV